MFVLKPVHDSDGIFYVMLIEMFYTGIFMSIVMHVKYAKICLVETGMLKNLTVVIGLYGLICSVDKITEACFNPAFGLCAILF